MCSDTCTEGPKDNFLKSSVYKNLHCPLQEGRPELHCPWRLDLDRGSKSPRQQCQCSHCRCQTLPRGEKCTDVVCPLPLFADGCAHYSVRKKHAEQGEGEGVRGDSTEVEVVRGAPGVGTVFVPLPRPDPSAVQNACAYEDARTRPPPRDHRTYCTSARCSAVSSYTRFSVASRS